MKSWRVELESAVGGGAEVRASGYGVFAEVPRGGASGHRQRALSGAGLAFGRRQLAIGIIDLLLLIRRGRLAKQGAFLRRQFPLTHSRPKSLPTSPHHLQCEEDQSHRQPCPPALAPNQHAKQQTKKQSQSRPQQAMQPKDGGANDVPQHGQTIPPRPRARFPQDEAATGKRPLQDALSRNLRYHGIRSFRSPQHLFQF